MGRNQIYNVAIVHASTKQEAVVMTAASREFCIVLETMGTAKRVIQPFIVWASTTHRDTYYKQNDQDPND